MINRSWGKLVKMPEPTKAKKRKEGRNSKQNCGIWAQKGCSSWGCISEHLRAAFSGLLVHI